MYVKDIEKIGGRRHAEFLTLDFPVRRMLAIGTYGADSVPLRLAAATSVQNSWHCGRGCARIPENTAVFAGTPLGRRALIV